MDMVQQLSPWATTESSENGDERYTRMTLDRAREQVALMRELREQQRRLDAEIEQRTRHLATLNALLRDLGHPPVEAPGGIEKKPAIGAPGNRSSTMPARRPQFEGKRLSDAVQWALEGHDDLHADDLVRLIFDVQSPKEHKAAKHSLVSTLAQGVKDGRLERSGPNIFRLRSAEGDHTGVNGATPSNA